MRKIRFGFLGILQVLILTVLPGAASQNPQTAFNDEYLILFAASPTLHETVSQKAKLFNDRKDAVFSRIPQDFALSHRLNHLPLAVAQTRNPEVLDALHRQPEVLAVIPNRQIFHQLTESLPLIRQELPVAAGYGGQGTCMAIIDTGIDYLSHDEFGGCTDAAEPASCRILDAVDVASDDGSLDDNGHGTHVAAIAAAVAPAADLVAIDVFDGTTSSDALVLAGIDWAIAHQADYNIVAINLSLGDGSDNTSSCSSHFNPYVTAVTNARDAGILVVAAAGNEGYTDGISRPACTPDVISVGAVYDANVGGINYSSCSDTTTAPDQVTCFSNSADFMSLWAPGALITAAGMVKAGTSQAAPHVTGVLAVFRSAYSEETLTQTTSRLLSATTLVSDPRNGVSLPRLDMKDAVDFTTTIAVPGMTPRQALMLAAGLFVLGGRRTKNNDSPLKN